MGWYPNQLAHCNGFVTFVGLGERLLIRFLCQPNALYGYMYMCSYRHMYMLTRLWHLQA